MKAMILAAGYGTRLRPVTFMMPKPMVPVCNLPLIGWAVENFVRAGVRDLIVNLHHLPEQMERWLRETYSEKVHFDFSYEPEILGTGGGIRKVRALLQDEEDFFLVNGDTIQFPRYDDLRAARKSVDAIAALTLRHPPESDRFTPVWRDAGLVTGFGAGSGEALMFAGSHSISTRVFDYLPEKEFSGVVDEVYMPLLANGKEKLAAIVDDGLWFDIGTPERYLDGARELVELIATGKLAAPTGSRVLGDSLVHNTSSASGALSRSTVGARTTIRGELRDSYVWDDCYVAGSVVLDRCIVGHGVEISRPMELRDAIICREDAAIPRDANYERTDGMVIGWI
jgi:NDP-sugar pyrophosphorylase family protein